MPPLSPQGETRRFIPVSCGIEVGPGGQRVNVTVMVAGFAQDLYLLLSPVMHWGVLINTNARYGCEEGIQTLGNEVFAYRKLCDPPTYASRELEEALRGVKCIHIHLRVFLEPIS